MTDFAILWAEAVGELAAEKAIRDIVEKKLKQEIDDLKARIQNGVLVWRKDLMYNPYAPTWNEEDWEKGRWIKDE